MKTTYRTTHIYKPRSRAERALTLAVLTALLSGAPAAPAMAAAKNVTIEEGTEVEASGTDHKACLTYDANAKETDENKTNSTSGNTLIILGKVIRSGGYQLDVAAAYSGGADDLSENHVIIQGGMVNNNAWVYGGRSEKGSVTKNTVTISGGTVNNIVYGGYSTNGAATGNSVTLSGSTVNDEVYGGWSNASGEVKGNQLTMSAGEVKNIYGGYSWYGSATGNSVIISSGTVKGDVSGGTVVMDIFRDSSDKGSATSNVIKISGGTITGNVVGGASPKIATDNKIILAKGAAAANLQKATLMGFDEASTHSGNTLTVEGEKNITVGNVKNFDVYDFQLGDVKNGDTILNLLNDTNLGDATVKVTNAGNVIPTGDITGDRTYLYLMKLADGKTLTFNGTIDVEGFTPISKSYQNDAKTATFTMSRAAGQSGNDLAIYDKVAYTCDLSPEVLTNGAKLLSYENAGPMALTDEDVTLNNADALDGKMLSLNKGDTVYLLENTAGGALTYTGSQKLTPAAYTNEDKTATITTTGEVAADGNDLVLKIDGVKYNFVLAPRRRTNTRSSRPRIREKRRLTPPT